MSNNELKRKVLDTSLDLEEERKIFHRSKLVVRSPDRAEVEMDPIMKAIREMKAEMRNGFEDGRKQSEAVRLQLEKINEELEQIKEEMKSREIDWKEEKQLLSQASCILSFLLSLFFISKSSSNSPIFGFIDSILDISKFANSFNSSTLLSSSITL